MKRNQDPFPPTPMGFHLRVEQTLCELEEENMKKGKLTLSLAAALTLILITATAFAAAAFWGGRVDWTGNITPYTEEEAQALHPLPTPTIDQPTLAERRNAILADTPAGEYWEIRTETEGHGWFGNDDLRFTTVEDMREILGDAGLPVPELGDSFSLQQGYVYFDKDPTLEKPYSEEEVPGLGTLYKYRLSDASLTGGTGYYIDLLLGAETVHLNAYSHSTAADSRDYAFDIGPDETVIPLTLPGYDALCVEYTDELGFHRTVSLQKLKDDRRIRIDIFTSDEAITAETLLSLY